MKIIIDIEDGEYKWIMEHASNDPNDYTDSWNIFFRKAVEHGIVIPKDHGDLIDVDVAFKEFDKACLSWEGELLKYIPVVIPATTYKEAKNDQT